MHVHEKKSHRKGDLFGGHIKCNNGYGCDWGMMKFEEEQLLHFLLVPYKWVEIFQS